MTTHYVASTAKIIADSIGPSGVRLRTWECEWPRFCHADMMTHRALSRNGRSSRAEPVQRAIDRAMREPVRPLVWMYDAKQMKPGEVMSNLDRIEAESLWFSQRDHAVSVAQRLLKIGPTGLHRQYLTRLIEPFLRIKMIVSTTQPANLYAVRIHEGPMPEVQQAVIAMARAEAASTPRILKANEWHLPYITDEERSNYSSEFLVKISTSRCARVSYDTLDGKVKPIAEDVKLHDQLVTGYPKHVSPTEHQARAIPSPSHRSGNFHGWIQYRKEITGEVVRDDRFDTAALLKQWEGRDYIV